MGYFDLLGLQDQGERTGLGCFQQSEATRADRSRSVESQRGQNVQRTGGNTLQDMHLILKPLNPTIPWYAPGPLARTPGLLHLKHITAWNDRQHLSRPEQEIAHQHAFMRPLFFLYEDAVKQMKKNKSIFAPFGTVVLLSFRFPSHPSVTSPPSFSHSIPLYVPPPKRSKMSKTGPPAPHFASNNHSHKHASALLIAFSCRFPSILHLFSSISFGLLTQTLYLCSTFPHIHPPPPSGSNGRH